MNEQNQRDSIMSMARGAFEESVDYEKDKVIQNILDPNTKATAKRKITLTIELTPDELVALSMAAGWVDVCKGWQAGGGLRRGC